LAKSLARDLLRIVAFIPFHSANLEKVIDRAWWWADDVFVRTYADNDVDAIVYGDMWAHELAVDSIQEAWLECAEVTNLQEGDYVAIIHPDEVLVDSQVIKPAIRNNYGKAIGVQRVLMYDDTHVNADWPPATVWPFIPYKPQGRFLSYSGQARGPYYAMDLNRVDIAAATMLSYQYATPEQRTWWTRISEGSWMMPPSSLEKWKGGGTL
jgi:hypothetical protein